ncbi:MAG: type I-B CRISPR-associated protein Cas7/Cst2/DevR [Caldisericia bacterium]
MNKIKNLTLTIIFEGSALNRDEKIGGNILSIKKLNIDDEVYSFIGKPAIRHYLFQTLNKLDGEYWKPTPTILQGRGDQQTVQFDLTKGDILEYPEIDIFGYMFTIEGERALTRKSPLGITKAISLIGYESDISFYSNHDLVSRTRLIGEYVQPNIYNKEEHSSFYKLSFTLDTDLIGKDTWILENEPKVNGDSLIIILSKNNVKEIKGEKIEENQFKTEKGIIKWEKVNKLYKITFIANDEEIKKRIRNILYVIKNGFYSQSSGELNTIVPLFLIAAAVKVPSPIIHPYVNLIKDENSKRKVLGLNDILKNSWIEILDNKKLIFVQDSERIPMPKEIEGKVLENFDEFLNLIDL